MFHEYHHQHHQLCCIRRQEHQHHDHDDPSFTMRHPYRIKMLSSHEGCRVVMASTYQAFNEEVSQDQVMGELSCKWMTTNHVGPGGPWGPGPA